MNRTQTIGLISELAFTRRCIELGLEVLAPIGVERYDLVLVLGGEFERVQVKTGLYRNGGITFATSSNAEGVGRPRSYDGDADLIGVYAPALDRCYLLPVDGCARRHGRLRVAPAEERPVGGHPLGCGLRDHHHGCTPHQRRDVSDATGGPTQRVWALATEAPTMRGRSARRCIKPS